MEMLTKDDIAKMQRQYEAILKDRQAGREMMTVEEFVALGNDRQVSDNALGAMLAYVSAMAMLA